MDGFHIDSPSSRTRSKGHLHSPGGAGSGIDAPWPSKDDLTLNLYDAARRFPQVVHDLRQVASHAGSTSSFTDHHFIKFARARKMKKKDAEDMLREHIGWRLEKNVDGWIDPYPVETQRLFNQHHPVGYTSTASGMLVLFEQQRRTNLDALESLIDGKQDASEAYAQARVCARVEQSSRRFTLAASMFHGRLILNTTMVKDLSGMGVVQLVSLARKNFSKMSSKTLSDHYPESLNKVYVVTYQ